MSVNMSESDTHSRTHRSRNRLAQFGLYKYDSTEPLYKPQNERYKFGVVFLLSLLLTFLLVLFFLIITLTQDQPEVAIHRNLLNTLIPEPKYEDFDSVEAIVVPTNSPWQPQIHFDSDSESRNSSEIETTSPEPPQAQKLIFFPPRELRPPKIVPNVVKEVQKRRRSDVRRVTQPRPFIKNPQRIRMTSTGRPLVRHSTKYPSAVVRYDPTQRLIYPDPLTNFDEKSANEPFRPVPMYPIPVVGRFRRPKNTLRTTTSIPTTFIPTDPFIEFKPHSPEEVNHLLYDRSQLTIGGDDNHLNRAPQDPEEWYNNMLTAGRIRKPTKLGNLQRGDQSRHKPFQLMLDVYPMANGQKLSTTTVKPGRKRQRRPGSFGRFSPYAAHFNAQNAARLEKNYFDPAYHFNTMRFAQIAPQNPYNPLYNDPHYREKVLLQKYENEKGSQPSQLVVHLNLYPKNKKRKNKNKDTDVDYEDHPTELFRRSDEGVEDSSETREDEEEVQTTQIGTDATTQPVSINFNINSTPSSVRKTQDHLSTHGFQPINFPVDRSDHKLVSYGPPGIPILRDSELTTYRPSRRPSFPFKIENVNMDHQHPTILMRRRVSVGNNNETSGLKNIMRDPKAEMLGLAVNREKVVQ